MFFLPQLVQLPWGDTDGTTTSCFLHQHLQICCNANGSCVPAALVLQLGFFLPQLVQLLRGDTDGAITNCFLTPTATSQYC